VNIAAQHAATDRPPPSQTIAAQSTGGNCFGGQARLASKTARGAEASSFAPPASRGQARGQALAPRYATAYAPENHRSICAPRGQAYLLVRYVLIHVIIYLTN
jgi:hypothetical protein